MHHFGVSCSYDEILRFKASAMSAASKQSKLRGIMHCDAGLVQAVADKFDASISSANGLRFTHALALPPQKVTLTVTDNKVQLIGILCQHLKDQCSTFPANGKLVVTSNDPVPFEINNGVIVQRVDMRTTHEEADIIIVQQVVKLAQSGNTSIKVVCDDTDVLVLLVHFYAQNI